MFKRIILTLVVSIITVSGFAQDGLKGTWSQKHSMMGLSATETMYFSGNESGKISMKATISINSSMLGIKISAEYAGSQEGTFTYDGSKIVIDWNPDTVVFKEVKGVQVTYKGEAVEDQSLATQFKELIDETKAEMMKYAGDTETLTDVKLSAKKLSFKSIDDEGKPQTETFTRIN